jgi:hypothetical protein
MQISANNVSNLLNFYVRCTRHTNEIRHLWFHGGVYSDYTLLGCDTVTYAERTTKYRHLPPTALTVYGGRISLEMFAPIRMIQRPQRS